MIYHSWVYTMLAPLLDLSSAVFPVLKIDPTLDAPDPKIDVAANPTEDAVFRTCTSLYINPLLPLYHIRSLRIGMV